MASNDTLFILDPTGSSPTGTIFSVYSVTADGSTPTTNTPFLKYVEESIKLSYLSMYARNFDRTSFELKSASTLSENIFLYTIPSNAGGEPSRTSISILVIAVKKPLGIFVKTS